MSCSFNRTLDTNFKKTTTPKVNAQRLQLTFFLQMHISSSDAPLTLSHYFQYAEGIKSEIIFINSSLTIDIILSSIYVVKLGNELSCMARLCTVRSPLLWIHTSQRRARGNEFVTLQSTQITELVINYCVKWMKIGLVSEHSERLHIFIYGDLL